MNIIEILSVEHRDIARVLDRLEEECLAIHNGGPVRPRVFMRVSFFLSNHVDECHQAKERALFQALAPHGLAIAPGPVRRIVQEHEMTHEHGARIGALAALVQKGIGDVDELISASMAYVRHFREHAREEEAAVFPLARRLLGPHVMELLRSRIARIEATHLPMGQAALDTERAFEDGRGLFTAKLP